MWRPTDRSDRYRTLDVLRGLALFGVLQINLLHGFRVSLFQHIRSGGADAGWVDTLASVLLEFKAFALFSFLFGVGVALQAERAQARGVDVAVFLVRRFAVLFAFGLCHMLLVWNGDILALYGVCGLLLIPFRRASWRLLLLAGAAVSVSPYLFSPGMPLPPSGEWEAHIAAANRIYSGGTYGEILRFRYTEALRWILPLLLASLQRTLGLMLLGMGAWRSGLLKSPVEHRTALFGIFAASACLGTVLALGGLDASIPIAFMYGSAVFLLLSSSRAPALTALASAGQMALTNYLMQSILFGFVFYSYGLGLFGRLDSPAAAMIGIALYSAQLAFSTWWLRRFRFGPFEWVWRSLTYGRNLSSTST